MGPAISSQLPMCLSGPVNEASMLLVNAKKITLGLTITVLSMKNRCMVEKSYIVQADRTLKKCEQSP